MVLVNHGARWGPDANRHSGKETAPSRYVDLFHHVCHCRARLPGYLASCGGYQRLGYGWASCRRAGRATTARTARVLPARRGQWSSCLTKEEGHQIRQCRDSGSSPDARVATWSRHTRTLQAGTVSPDDITHQHGHGRRTTFTPQHLCSWRHPARPRGPKFRGVGEVRGFFWHFSNANVNNKGWTGWTAGLGLSGCSWQASGIAFLGISHPTAGPCPAWPRVRPENSDAGTDRSCHHCNPGRRPCPLEGGPLSPSRFFFSSSRPLTPEQTYTSGRTPPPLPSCHCAVSCLVFPCDSASKTADCRLTVDDCRPLAPDPSLARPTLPGIVNPSIRLIHASSSRPTSPGSNRQPLLPESQPRLGNSSREHSSRLFFLSLVPR